MRPFLDDYDELDESGFESFAATRRELGRTHKLHHKSAGRKRRGRTHHDRWADADFDSFDDNDDYSDVSFDRYRRLRFDD